MKMKFLIFITLGILFSNVTFSQPQVISNDTLRKCSEVIEEVSYYWKLDSLGNNGFRQCAYRKILNSKLDKISKSFLIEKFGKPNQISEKFNADMEYIYYYFDILAMPKNYDAPLATWYISFLIRKNENCVSWINEGDIDR